MSIKQQIYDLIELTKVSEVPVLLVSNPGYAKTTNIKNYADENGYHLETLIGSRFNPDDIMGYQVNDPTKNTLVQKDPMWYDRIIQYESQGTHSILFIDELSTCSDSVQGSLLSLIFDRAIGNGKKLPADCLVLSAANYFGNLPSFMNIMAPTLNRFCIINLLSNFNNNEIVQEFLTEAAPAIKRRRNRNVDYNLISETFLTMFKNIMIKYSNVNNSLGYIDLQNSEINDMYQKNTIYNVITGRSLYYLKKMTIALAELEIYNRDLTSKIVGGLVGLGSNSFKSDEQIENFISTVTNEICSIVRNVGGKEKSVALTGSVTDEIKKYFNNLESKEINEDYLSKLVDYISEKYSDPLETFQNIKNKTLNDISFTSDIDSIYRLFKFTNDGKLAALHQENIYTYSCILGGAEKITFDDYDYGIYKPNCFKIMKIAKNKETDELIKVGCIGSETNEIYCLIPKSVSISDANFGKSLPKSKIEILTIK